jgi:Flp pilus assembly protein protease CpaA
MWLAKAIACSLLAILIYQDFKDRKVSLLVLILLGLSGIYFNYLRSWDWVGSGLNVTFILILCMVVFIYGKIKGIETANLLGTGDIVYLFALIPWFDFPHYIYAVTYSLIGALLLHMILTRLNSLKNPATIPLISYLGLINMAIIVTA